VTIDIGTAQLLGFLLGMVRAVAWITVVPPFSTRIVPSTVKVGLAVALTLPVAPRLAASAPSPDVASIVTATVVQVTVGVALGFLTYLLFAAVQAAGDVIDLFGGFSLASAYDPLSLNQNAVFGKLHNLLAIMLLFAVNGHLVVVRGFLASYDALPLDAGLSLHKLSDVLVHGLGVFFLAALQIAGPLVGVLFLADVGLGLLTRVAPQLNVFSLGFPTKIFLTLVLLGLTFPLLPQAVESIIEQGVQSVLAVARA